MGVTFSVSREPIAWALSCPFDDRTFQTHQEAYEALKSHAFDGHNPGPCQAHLDWAQSFGDDWSARTDAVDEHHALTGVYLDYCESGAFTKPVYQEDVEEVHLHNQNARLVLDALGYLSLDEEGYEVLWGQDDADRFLGKLLLAEVLDQGDPGVPVQEYQGQNGARVIDMGRREGTRQELFERLRPMVLWAQERELQITWS